MLDLLKHRGGKDCSTFSQSVGILIEIFMQFSEFSGKGAQQADRMESGQGVKTGDSWPQTLLANLPSGRKGHSNASSQDTLPGQC